MVDVVLAIDPGSMKCGVAVVSRSRETICRDVIDTPHLGLFLREIAREHKPEIIVVGNGTASASVVGMIQELALAPVEVIDEKFTTLLARDRYFKENPPKGLRRLLPISLQTPPVAFDDYVAVILAERYLGVG